MIIVEGWIEVPADQRDGYLAECRTVVEQARSADGFLTFSLSANPLEPSRVNVIERWTTVDALTAFRGSGPDDDQRATILDAEVYQYVVASQIRL